MTRKQQLAEPEVRPSDAQLPDLVGVVMADGREGYVYKTDLLQAGTPASSPKEGLARTGQRRVLTVYAQDGFTVLGVFMVGPTPTGRD